MKYGEAIKQVAEEINAPLSLNYDPEKQRKRAEEQRLQQAFEEKERMAQASEKTERLYVTTKPIDGTIAERYLREHRKITGDLPESLRFLPVYKDPSTNKLYPALVAFASDPEGKRTAAQITCLDPESANKADVEVKKRSQGVIKGSVVEIQSSNVEGKSQEKEEKGVTYVAEGIETALSLKEAGIQGRIVATLGLSNMANVGAHVKDKSETIVLCADADDKDTPARKTSEKSLEILKESGFNVTIVRPDGEKGRDFNDVLKDQGVEAVRSSFESILSHTKDITANIEPEAPSTRARESAEKPRTQENKSLSIETKADISQKDVSKASPSKFEKAIAEPAISELPEKPSHKGSPAQDVPVQNKKDPVDAFKEVLEEREKMPLLLKRSHAQKERNLELKKQGMDLAVEIKKDSDLIKKAESLNLYPEIELYHGYYKRDNAQTRDELNTANPTLKEKDLVDAFKDVLDERKNLPFMLRRTNEERERNLELKQEGLKLATAIEKDVILSGKADKFGLTKEVAHYASIHRDEISQAKSRERDGHGMGM